MSPEPSEHPDPPTNDEPEPSNSSEQPTKKAGCFKIGCLTLMSMMLVVALAAGGIALYLNHELGKVQRSDALLPRASAGDPTRDITAGDAQNILLLGSDSRGTNLRANGRSDVIQLMHISADRRTISIVHFPRDLYVAIPGYGKNKINAAYSYGGAPLLVRTMQQLLNVHIDHVAQIGFDGFTKLTDALGGVDVYVRYGYSEGDFGTWTKGYHHMNGAQALGFSRERHQLPRGDIDRGVDQQEWINSIVKKSLSRGTLENPKRLLDTFSSIAPYMLVDMSSSYIVKLGVSLRNLRGSDITYYTAPFSGFATNAVGDVDVVDVAGMRRLGVALRTDRMSTAPVSQNSLG